jgi:hypothetical protein
LITWLLRLYSKYKQTNKDNERTSKERGLIPLIGKQDSIYEKEAETWANMYMQHKEHSQTNHSPQEFLGSKLKFNFSNIQIHADNDAANNASRYNAQAFTYGPDIYFAKGKYEPQTLQGQQLIAHELIHVMQQNTRIPTQIQKQKAQPELEKDAQESTTDSVQEQTDLLEQSRSEVKKHSVTIAEQVKLYRAANAAERSEIEQVILLAERDLAKSLEMKIDAIEKAMVVEPKKAKPLKKELNMCRSDLEKLKMIFLPEAKTDFEALYPKKKLWDIRLSCMDAAYQGMSALFGTDVATEIKGDVRKKAEDRKKEDGVNIDQYITVMETVKEKGKAGTKLASKYRKNDDETIVWTPRLHSMVLNEVNANIPGYYFFGLSIADAYHSVILMVDTWRAKSSIYWYDQHGVTKIDNLDNVVNQKIATWWSISYNIKETAIWPLIPPPNKGIFKDEE